MEVTTIGGTRSSTPATSSGFSNPNGIAYSVIENALYIGCNEGLRRLDLKSRAVTICNTAIPILRVYGVAVAGDGIVIFGCVQTLALYAVNPSNGHTVRLLDSLSVPYGIDIDENKGRIYVCDQNNHTVHCIQLPYFD